MNRPSEHTENSSVPRCHPQAHRARGLWKAQEGSWLLRLALHCDTGQMAPLLRIPINPPKADPQVTSQLRVKQERLPQPMQPPPPTVLATLHSACHGASFLLLRHTMNSRTSSPVFLPRPLPSMLLTCVSRPRAPASARSGLPLAHLSTPHL